MDNVIRKKYFGTDGFRGRAGVELTADHAYKIGRFLGWYYASPLSGCSTAHYRPKIAVGKDTRRSGYMLEYALAAGITASGADAYMLHVITTPGVSYAVRSDGLDCGVIITASHNPFYDNGIKVVGSSGEKLDEVVTAKIESYLNRDLSTFGVKGCDLPLANGCDVGKIIDHVAGRNRYVAYLISLASNSYKNLSVGLDTGNGAAWMIAGAVFGALGARVHLIGNAPNGTNINDGCGSTHPEALTELVCRNNLDVGFAFDGDGDRCICVDEHGDIVSGDGMLYVLARRLKGLNMLHDNTVVATVMSNSGLDDSLAARGISCVKTNVGDKFVYEKMLESDLSLGGEQSGHVILKKYATTGDGILTALMMTEEICDKKTPLSGLVDGLTLYPQHLINVPVLDKQRALSAPAVQTALAVVKSDMGGVGRVLLRPSGTEPVVRVMAEHPDQRACRLFAEKIADALRSVL